MTETTIQRIERKIAEEKIKEEIRCPYCGHEQDQETKYEYISYNGDDIKKCSCEECSKEFMVKENVVRTFDTKKMEDYNAEEWWS